MKQATTTVTLGIASAILLALGVSGAWANEPGYGRDGYGGSGHGAMGNHGMGMMHQGAGHLIRHLLKHESEIGLTADQVAKLKEIQLGLDKARIKAEADIQIAERELKALTDDEKADLGTIEAKVRQSEDLQVALRMTSIKTRREVLSLLTPEQRAKEKAEHEKVMRQHREGEKGHGSPHGGMPPHGANPHGKNPHEGYGGGPAALSNMSVQ
jgi:Spy/CpxP family protein refolding chaperone